MIGDGIFQAGEPGHQITESAGSSSGNGIFCSRPSRKYELKAVSKYLEASQSKYLCIWDFVGFDPTKTVTVSMSEKLLLISAT